MQFGNSDINDKTVLYQLWLKLSNLMNVCDKCFF